MPAPALVPASSTRKFIRKPPPMPVRLLFAAFIHGVMVPAKWGTEHSKTFAGWMDKLGERRKGSNFDKSGFDGFMPGPQDVFIPTFSKSGTNWMMQIALQLVYHGDVEFDHIHELVPWPDMKRLPYAIPLKLADHWQTAPERKRVIKTHLDWQHLPYSAQSHYICVIRDPKDVFVSSYHFAGSILGAGMPSIETWFKMFVNERFPFGGSWVKNTAGYWAAASQPNVLVCSFKEMKQDLRGTVGRVAKFLKMQVDSTVIDRVTERASFDYMKKHDSQFAMFQMMPWGDPVVMIREGKHGASGSLLTSEMRRQLDDRFQARLRELGSDFPYERFCELTR